MATGRDIKAAFKKGTIWHTAAIAGAGDGILILSEGIPARLPEYLRVEEAGLPFAKSYDQGNVDISGHIDAYLRYVGLDVLMAVAMGQAGPPSQPDPVNAPTVYRNSYRLADRLDGLFGTLVIDKGVSIWEYPSVKVLGFELRGEAGGPVRIRFEMMADDLKRSGDEATSNTPATLSSVTFPTFGLRAMFEHMRFRINEGSGPALTDAHQVYPSSFIFRYRRIMRGEHVADLTKTIVEPVEERMPEVGLELRFDRYSGDDRFNDITRNRPMKADLLFQGPVISGGHRYEFKLLFPSLIATEARASISGPGHIVHTVAYDALSVETAPAGMTVMKPFQIDVQNTRGTDPLT